MAALILGMPLAAGPTTAEAMRGWVPLAPVPPPVATPVEFWCSPGFEPSRGRCVATLSRDELYIYDTEAAPPVRRRHRRGLRTLY